MILSLITVNIINYTMIAYRVVYKSHGPRKYKIPQS